MQGGQGVSVAVAFWIGSQERGTCATGSVGRRFYCKQAEKDPRIWLVL